MENTSVVEALKAYKGDRKRDGTYTFPEGLYKETGRVEEQMLISILPNGERREHKMSEIDFLDLKIFADELDIALKLQNPYVQSLFAKNAVGLANLIRVVNVETASGFKGAVGAGRQLDCLLLRAEQFQDPDAGPWPAWVVAPRTSWIRNITAAMVLVGPTNFIERGTNAVAHGEELPMAVDEAVAILGFANPATTPRIDAVQISYLAQAYNIQNLDFELANPMVGDAICELKQPLYIYPRESALITAKYFLVGANDETRPIGLWVKMSSNLRALLTS